MLVDILRYLGGRREMGRVECITRHSFAYENARRFLRNASTIDRGVSLGRRIRRMHVSPMEPCTRCIPSLTSFAASGKTRIQN